jgi:hypothetical protein
MYIHLTGKLFDIIFLRYLLADIDQLICLPSLFIKNSHVFSGLPDAGAPVFITRKIKYDVTLMIVLQSAPVYFFKNPRSANHSSNLDGQPVTAPRFLSRIPKPWPASE